MFFLDVIDRGADYRFMYYKIDKNTFVKTHMFKNTDLKKIEVSSTNPIMYRFFYNLHEKEVFIVDDTTIDVLNEIYRGQHKFHKNNYIVYSDFYNWCIEQGESNEDIRSRLYDFENTKKHLESYSENHRIQIMLELYNCIYLDYKEEYNKSIIIVEDGYEETETEIETIYHLIDSNSIVTFDFLDEINESENNKLVFFANNCSKKIDFYTLAKILKHKHLEIEVENYDINILIQAYLLSINNLNRCELRIYTSRNNKKVFEYLIKRSNLNIEIVDVDSKNTSINNWDDIDINISILDDEDDDYDM